VISAKRHGLSMLTSVLVLKAFCMSNIVVDAFEDI